MSQLMISGVIDGPLPGGFPKAIQLFAIENIADLSEYSVDAASSGENSDEGRFTFPSMAMEAGSVIYLSLEKEAFATYFGFTPDYIVEGFDTDDDGAIELFRYDAVVDIFGGLNLDEPGRLLSGIQEVAYRAESAGPSSTFDLDEWVFSGTAAFDGEASSSSASGFSSAASSAAGFSGPLEINEYRFTATEDFRFTSNFVELLAEPGAQLNGLTMLILNGEEPNGRNDNIGQITWAVDLSNAIADENGFILVGNDALTTFDDGDVIVEGFDPNGNAQTILVVRDFTGAAGDDLDVDNDGNIDNPPFSEVIIGVGLRDEDRDRDVLYADDVVQADPLDDGFISAGAARQPDGGGAFVTLPYDTPLQDTPGFANVEDQTPEPVFEIQLGDITDDRIEGALDLRNLLAGKDGNDRLFGANEADLILDGIGNDRSFGAGGDDILFFQGGGKDVGFGGEGADIFKLSADYSDNGTRDRLVIRDFDTAEDLLDLTGAFIESIRIKEDRTVLRLVGDRDVIVLRDVTDFDEIGFTDVELPLAGVSIEQLGDLGGDSSDGAADILTLSSLDAAGRMRGSIGDDFFEFFGGDQASAQGNGGADSFVMTASMLNNGSVDRVWIRDIDENDVVDLSGFEITKFKECDNRVKVFVGPDNDRLVFSGVSSLDEIGFITDVPMG